MAISDTIATRSALRDALQRDLLDTLNQQFRPLLALITDEQRNGHVMSAEEQDAAILAGTRAMPELKVLTRKDVLEAVAAVFDQPLPPPPNDHAEVATIKGKATVTVAAECPECGIAHPILLQIGPELLVDNDGKELRIKAKAKGRPHTCGQLPLEEGTTEQMTVDDTLAEQLRIGILSAVSLAEDEDPAVPTVDAIAKLMDPPLESESDRGDLAETLDRMALDPDPLVEVRQDKGGPRTYWLTPAGDELLEQAEAAGQVADVDEVES